MTEPRAPLETEVDKIIGFLDRHLRPNHDWSIAAEYPHVFSLSNRNNIRIISSDSDQVLAHAAMKFLLIKNTFGIFKVAAIGSVLTDPQHRNQGLSQKIIENCLNTATAQGADFAILWTDLYDFYHKMGFELAGTEVSLVIEKNLPADNSNLRFLNTNKVSPDALLRLYSQHTCGTLRTSEDIRKNLFIPNTRIYTAWDQQNELLAYAIEGKGADLKGYVHEWGGNLTALIPLLAHVRREINAPLTVIAPAHAQNLIRKLQDLGALCNTGFLGMIRPLCLENIFFKIHRRARQLGIQNFVLEATGDSVRIGVGTDVAEIQNLGEFTRLIFGPIDAEQLKPEFQQLLPIPMWVWGWDSV